MTISMEEPAQKLNCLSNVSDLTQRFGHFLAEYILEEIITPEGFVIAYNAALHDLQAGVSSYTGKPIKNNLCGYRQGLYRILQTKIPDVAKTVFPEKFAAEVVFIYDRMEELSKKMNGGAH